MKTVSERDLDLLTMLMEDSPYSKGEDFDTASVNVIIINHFALPVNSPINVVELFYVMTDHIKENGGTAFSYDWEIKDGVLYADGKTVKRVGPHDPHPNAENFWRYIESRFPCSPTCD